LITAQYKLKPDLSFAKTGAALLPVTIATSRELIADDHDDWQA
jgi:hypothetical protein